MFCVSVPGNCALHHLEKYPERMGLIVPFLEGKE
jgi:hypothetical protein